MFGTKAMKFERCLRMCKWIVVIMSAFVAIGMEARAMAADPEVVTPKKLLATGRALAEKTCYVEALDLFDEARLLLGKEGKTGTGLYADALYALAETKIKGRLHQHFPAYYVKTALDEIQEANRIRERINGVLPQKMAEGYYLEGIIHKRFFMRKRQAVSCFVKAVNIDPGSVAAKRELSELMSPDEK